LLNAAVQSGNLDVVITLLARGLDVNAKDQYGQTPLIAATLAGQRKAVKYLLKLNANTEARFMRGSALDYAREIGDQEIIRLLENAGKLAA
jgi:ankyrin repeat protein